MKIANSPFLHYAIDIIDENFLYWLVWCFHRIWYVINSTGF